MITEKTFKVVQWTALPREVQGELSEWIGFSNDCFIEAHSECDGHYTWEEVRKWYEECKVDESFEQFCNEVLSKFDRFMLDRDDVGNDKLLIEVCW